MRLPVTSTEYVRIPVAASENGASINPTGDTVQIAFTTGSEPTNTDWKTASWETSSGTYYARILLGPSGTVQLAAGAWIIWIKITDMPEIPVRQAGRIILY